MNLNGLRVLHKRFISFTVIILCSYLQLIINAQEHTSKCNSCFTTEVVNTNLEEQCLQIELKITAQDCNQALSHFSVEVPFGTVSDAYNSAHWPMQLNSTDPTTNIYGLKVDEIDNFGENGQSASFTVNYKVCIHDEISPADLMSKPITVAYKAGNCIFTDNITLINNKLEATLTTTPIPCFGSNNGKISVSIINGTPPYIFRWNTGATTKDLNNLAAGIYNVTITDANNKNLTLETTISEPEPLKVNANIKHTQCGMTDGLIQTDVSGGIKPYRYTWNTGDTTAALYHLAGGQYSLTIADSLGCSQAFSYNLLATTDLSASINTSVIECFEEGHGNLTVEVSGGIAPYTYLWTNGDTTATAIGLNSGRHQVTITDANGCSITKTGYVIIKRLKISSSVQEPLCTDENSGAISLTISNGTEPYKINWNTGDTTSTIENLAGGWYWADITDSLGCTARQYVKIKSPQTIRINTTVDRQSCLETDSVMLVSVSGTGGTAPYHFYYNDQKINQNLTISHEGYYDFTAVDANGCSTTERIYIKRPDAGLNFVVNVQQPTCDQVSGSAEITINNGTAPYTTKWSDGNTTNTRPYLQAGSYQVTINDSIGCTGTHEFSIKRITHPSVSLITPNAEPECHTTDHILNAMVENAQHYNWHITDTSSTWHIQNEQMEQLLYTAGQGTATISLEAISVDGCKSIDTIRMTCTSSNTDEINIGSSDTTSIAAHCENTCFDIIPIECKQTSDGCYTYLAKVTTDGSCRYDLSHLTVEVKNGDVTSAYNTNMWASELNVTDPTSGLHGFKIDDISNFGKQEDAFTVRYKVCYADNEAQSSFIVAYKAAQCITMDTLTFDRIKQELIVQTYPNPFINHTTIEFTPDIDGDATLSIYGINGELIECLYSGTVNANQTYTFDFTPPYTSSNMYFYQYKCGDKTTYGKIIQTK